MGRFSKFGIVIAMCLGLLAGCATVGNDSLKNESKQSIASKIKEGETTMSEVKSMLGSPMSTSYTDGGLEVWTYEITHMSADAASYIPVVGLFAGSSSGSKKQLTILFDDKETVRKYKMNESAVKARTGLFNQ